MEKFSEFFDKLQADLSPEYVQKAYITAAIFGVVFFAMFLIAAIKQPKARGLGIATAIIQLASAISSAWYVISFHKATFFTVVEGTGSTMEEAKDAAAAALGEAMIDMLIGILPLLAASILVLVGWLFGLIYIVKVKSCSLKVLSIFALILQILRYVFISPIPFTSLFKGITEEAQAKNDMIFFIACAIPYILMFIGVMVGGKKEDVIAVEAVVEAPIVEPVVEPVVEAPVVDEAPVADTEVSSDVESAE
ncbi:MAG: hypothetical protein E7385_04765 [Ruminococcaceae bacterium]|nr:hypothetical protein [Oscillospiraceae bacterium]